MSGAWAASVLDPDGRVPVAVLGATGLVGQHLVRRLAGHPTLRLHELVGSEGRAGRAYAESVDWSIDDRVPPEAAGLELLGLAGGDGGGGGAWRIVRRAGGPAAPLRSPIVLSALPAHVARDLEPALARRGHLVCTNASAHRMSPDVPLVVPEINAAALARVADQPWAASGGALVANPNCVVTGLALALAPIERAWGIRAGAVVTLQALSGAGLGGPSALALLGNVVPHIEGEEEKIERELRKVLGAELALAVAVNRVPVLDGHMAHVFLDLRRCASPADVRAALDGFERPAELGCVPSLPERPLVVRDEPDRPQPALDARAGDGMVVSVGRIRSAPPWDVALTLVVHNAIRGAAGACLANAELCVERGRVGVGAL